MAEQRGKHDLLMAQVGDEFEPREFTVTEEMVERYSWANDDYNPWYMEGSPFGGRIASPTFLIARAPEMLLSYYASPPGGILSAKQEFEFINPLKLGKKVTMRGRLVDRYSKKGRDYFVSEYLAVDEDSMEIVRIRRTQAYPVVVDTGGTRPTDRGASTKPVDPTAYRPMKVTAGKEVQVGFEVESITKKMTLDKTRIFTGWPKAKNFHNDYAAAQNAGLAGPILMGNQVTEYLGELLIKFFGKGYLGGKLSMAVIRSVEPDDEITTRAVVREKVPEGDAVRLVLDVWCENQRGEKVVVGTASGLVF